MPSGPRHIRVADFITGSVTRVGRWGNPTAVKSAGPGAGHLNTVDHGVVNIIARVRQASGVKTRCVARPETVAALYHV